MPQSVILAVGVTAATSTDLIVAAGAVVTVGIYTASAESTALGAVFKVMIDTPSIDQEVGSLTLITPTVQLAGPGTFRVTRSLSAGKAYGVFAEV
jgi:hypothetical protein